MIYPYVGPEAIRRAAASQPEGAAIRAPDDLQRWLDEHPGAIAEPATFVVTLDGTLRVAPRRSEHVACAGGQPVLAAGEVHFERRASGTTASVSAGFRVALITNQSTGYCPEPDCWSAVAAALSAAGIERPAALTHAFTFRRCDACEQINLVKDDWFVCGNCEADLPRARNFARIAPAIRRANSDDAATIARIHVRGWQWAYRGLLPDAYLAALSVDERESKWRVQLAPDYRTWTFVAEAFGVALGFANVGGTDDTTLPARTGQLYALYQEPHAAGSGVGRALLTHAMNDWRARDFTAAVLWVLDTNARARRFYEKAGWLPDGATRLETRADHARQELRYTISLSAGA